MVSRRSTQKAAQLIQDINTQGEETKILMNQFMAAMYYLKVINNRKGIIVIKIVEN